MERRFQFAITVDWTGETEQNSITGVKCHFQEHEMWLLLVKRGDRMTYHFSKTVQSSFEDAISKVTDELKKEGFGVLTEIDVRETLKKKLNVDFRRYKILGACNPQFAYQALQAEDKIGTMLPCNVIVQETAEGAIEISAVDPVASMQAIDNPTLANTAEQVRARLRKVIESL
jgi:uncharacterized protein (DUF302 family)